MCEAFGEMVIQSILLFRFQWLVTKDKDFSSLGVSFQIYLAGVMSISFVTMVSTILKYHNRNRRNLRETFSLHTLSLIIFWIILLVIKVAVYVFGFMNNPGLFWVPCPCSVGFFSAATVAAKLSNPCHPMTDLSSP